MRLSDLNIEDYQVVITPTELKKELPLPKSARELVTKSRQVVKEILDGRDPRLFAVVGPCSIHDTGTRARVWQAPQGPRGKGRR